MIFFEYKMNGPFTSDHLEIGKINKFFVFYFIFKMEEHAPASSISKAFTLPFMPDRIQHDTGYQCRQESVSQRPVPSHDRTPVIHVQAHGTNVHRGYHENSIDIWGRGSYLGMAI